MKFKMKKYYANFTGDASTNAPYLPAKFELPSKNILRLPIFSNIRRDARYPETCKQFTSTFHHGFIGKTGADHEVKALETR